MKPSELPNGYRWFTWGTQPPTYDESTIEWIPALIEDGEFLTFRSNSWHSLSITNQSQWGEENVQHETN